MARVRMTPGRFKSKLKNEIEDNLEKAGLYAERKIKQTLSGQRSGEIYSLEGGGTYQASAPGEPPAVRTGNLRASITTRKMPGITPRVFVGTPVEYAARLELGDDGEIKQRPFLRSTISENSEKIARIIAS